MKGDVEGYTPLQRTASDLFMNADFCVVLSVGVVIVASGRACSLLSVPGHWEPPVQEHKRQAGMWGETRGQQPNPLCRNGSGDGSDQHWHTL